MAQLPIDESITRFKENEERIDGFVNGGGYVTSGGQVVEGVPAFIARKEEEIDATDAIAQTQANKDAAAVSATSANASNVAATAAKNTAVDAQNAAVAAKTAAESAAASASAGILGKATLADLNASLAYADGTIALVTNDATTSNNAYYRKSGASGSGSWVKATDRVTLVEARLQGLPWRSELAASLTTAEAVIANAIKAVVAFGFTGTARATQFRIVFVSKNDGTYADRISIGSESLFTHSFSGTAAGKDDGPVWVTTSTASGGYFQILIDYRELSNGVLYNSLSAKLLLSDVIYRDEKLESRVKTLETNSQICVSTWRDPASASLTTAEDQIRQAILAVEAVGMNRTDTYKIITFCKDDAVYQENLIISNAAGLPWASGTASVPGTNDGPVWVKCVRSGEAGYFNLLIDYRKITTTGILLNSGTTTKFILSSYIHQTQKLREDVSAEISNAVSALPQSVTALGRAIRVAIAGSSITWGQGWLGEQSYVGPVEEYLRKKLASTVCGSEMAITGTNSNVSNPLFYKGSAKLISGAGAKAAFSLEGDELSLCIGRERGNDGAALIDLYVNGSLYDSFSTWNDETHQTGVNVQFSGDGSTVKFDLGRAFTYNHVLTVGGVSKVVQMNTQGYGATFPGGVDALIIRKIVTVGGVPEVHHILWFNVAPATGTNNISITFDAGESVTYVKNSVGQTSKPLTGTNESPYGDGNVAFDPANPAGISSGLGFRETDRRSVITWKFETSATRNFEVRINGLDPRASGTPKLYLNFATNRMHHIQNAGIGGWSAGALLTDAGLNGVDDLKRFQPDFLLLESCTNDDWVTGVYRAWVTRTGLTDAQVRNDETAHYFNSVTYIGTDNYTVEDIRLTISAITENSITFNSTNATFNVEVGDVVVIGDFKGDNRRVVSRIIDSWNSSTKVATWKKPLRADEFAQFTSLSQIVGTIAYIKAAPTWVTNVETVIDGIKAAMPNVVLALGTSGIPNFRARRLEGYRELAEDICGRKGAFFADFYGETLNWQYSQQATTQLYLNNAASTTATGASEYTLFNVNGSKPDSLNDGNAWLYRGWSVKVNGVERINKGCHIVGGYKAGWPAATTVMSKSNTGYVGDDYKLVFTSDVPANGATVVVKRAAVKWATDDCHPGTPGLALFGRAVNAVLAEAATIAAAKPGRRN